MYYEYVSVSDLLIKSVTPEMITNCNVVNRAKLSHLPFAAMINNYLQWDHTWAPKIRKRSTISGTPDNQICP